MFTMSSILARTARQRGDRPAVVNADGAISWAQFVDRIARAASVLQQSGLRRGDRYGILSLNSPQYAELIYAGYWIGAVPVPINHRFAPPEMAYVLDNSECSLVIVDEQFSEAFNQADLRPWSDDFLFLMAGQSDATGASYEKSINSVTPAAVGETTADSDALLLYTGGTTGRAKGVCLTHRNIVSNAMQLSFELYPREDDVYLHVAPMFHSADLLAMPYVISGAAHVYLPKFSPSAFLSAVQSYEVTVVLMTPTMLIMTMQDPDFDKYDLSSLRQIIYGSSPMAAEWIKKMLASFEASDAIQAYGLTETSPLLTTLPMTDHRRALETGDDNLLQSVGRALPGVDIRIVDDESNALGCDEVGEIVVRGPNVASGYLKRPEASNEAFKGDWFYTGDIGRVDDHGYLFLLDRKKGRDYHRGRNGVLRRG